YSHSFSCGRANFTRPPKTFSASPRPLSLARNAAQSAHETCSAGKRFDSSRATIALPPPPPPNQLGPPPLTAYHSACVTGYFASQKPLHSNLPQRLALSVSIQAPRSPRRKRIVT